MPPELSRRLAMMKVLTRLPFVVGMMRRKAARNPEAAARRAIADPELRARTLNHPEAGPLMAALLSSRFNRLRHRFPGTVNDIAQFPTIDVYPLAQIGTPVVFIHGTSDRAVPCAHGEAVVKLAPRSELPAIEGGEHFSLFTHLDTVRARVESFFAAHAPKGSSGSADHR